MPKVSIIVPVYNKENYISRCIEFIQKQTMTDWELVLVDDFSTDRSMDIMNGYAKQDSRIRVRDQEENHGPMIARRIGDEMASGDYITYCDADDFLPQTALQRLYEEAINTKADIVSGNYLEIASNGEEITRVFSLKYGTGPEGILKSLLNKELKHVLWAKLFKASLIKNNNYNTIDHMTNAEDGYILYQIILNVHKVIHIPDVVYCYKQTSDSLTKNRYKENVLENICQFCSLCISYIPLFPNLKRDIIRYVSDILINLEYIGHNNHNLKNCLIKYNLSDYCSNHIILRYYSLFPAIRLLLKKYYPFHK